MSRARWIILLVVAVPCLLWASYTLRIQLLRIRYQPVIYALETRAPLPDAALRATALADYTRMAEAHPCNRGLQHDRLLLLAQAADDALRNEDLRVSDTALAAMQSGLQDAIACNPMDGKAWLDLATVITVQEGFSREAREAYQQSAAVAPKEAWLAEKRLMFATKFAAFFDARTRRTAREDIAVLAQAAGFRKTNVIRTAKLADAAALDALFAAP